MACSGGGQFDFRGDGLVLFDDPIDSGDPVTAQRSGDLVMPGRCVTAGESDPPKPAKVVERHTGGLRELFGAFGGQYHPHGFSDREHAVDLPMAGAVTKQRHIQLAEQQRRQLISATCVAQLHDEVREDRTDARDRRRQQVRWQLQWHTDP